MKETCTHSESEVGVCPRCGACTHELVLNGACFYCGEEEIERTIKPKANPVPQDFVPIESLRHKG